MLLTSSNHRGLIVACLVLSIISQAVNSQRINRRPRISISPFAPPLVGSDVQITCQGLLGHGGLLFRSPEGNPYDPNTGINLLQFSVKSEPSKNGSGIVYKPMVVSVNDSNLAKRVMPSLSMNRTAIKFTFRVEYSDNGFYGCKYFAKNQITIAQLTNTVGVFSYYSTAALKIEASESRRETEEIKKVFNRKLDDVNEVLEEVPKFTIHVTCHAFSGIPVSCAKIDLDGEPVPNQSSTRDAFMISSYRGYNYTVKAELNATMALVGHRVRCLVGLPCPGQTKSANPKLSIISEWLNVEVPVHQTAVVDTVNKFRSAGERLHCYTRGYPLPKIVWYLNGNKTQVTGSRFPVPKEPGLYTAVCKSKNHVLNKTYRERSKFHFAVVPKNCMQSGYHPAATDVGHREDTGLIVASALAAVFGVIAIIAIIGWCLERRRRGYNEMK